MTDATSGEVEPAEKSGKTRMILGLILALAGAAGGFYLTSSGMLPIGGKQERKPADAAEEAKPVKPLPAVSFVDLPPVILAVKTDESRHLKFHAQLEVHSDHAGEVEKMLPRIMDVLNTYLRAIETSDLEDSLALVRIRGHLLRRIGIVVGEGRVRDVLIMEFVLN